MSIFSKKTIPLQLAQIAIMLVLMMVVNVAKAEAEDKILTINVDANNCVTSITSNGNNCTAAFGVNACENKKDCICSKKDKHVAWDISKKQKFEIQFTGKSPFKQNCDLIADEGNRIKCKVAVDVNANTDYYYAVNVAACASGPYDPIIIIGR